MAAPSDDIAPAASDATENAAEPAPLPAGEAALASATESEAAAVVEPGRRRKWGIRLILAAVVLAALAIAGRKYYGELHRLRQVPAWLILLIALLWLASRYPAADVMRVALLTLRHGIGRYEAFMLQMVQSYGNVLIPRAGIGMPALYLKARHGVSFADLGAVQMLPMTLLQILTIGLMGLAVQAVLAAWGESWDRPLAALFAAAAVLCAAPLLLPLPPDVFGRGRVGRFFARLVEAWRKLGRSRALLARSLVTHAVMLLVRALRIQLCFYAVGHRVSYLGALVASLLADLAFVVSVTPASLGFREGALVYSARVMHTTGDVAMAAAILDRLISTACNVVVGQVGIVQFIRPVLRGGTGGNAGADPAGHGARSGPPGF